MQVTLWASFDYVPERGRWEAVVWPNPQDAPASVVLYRVHLPVPPELIRERGIVDALVEREDGRR